jgi:hypothetical protein
MADVNDLQAALNAPPPTQVQIIETWLALKEAHEKAEQAAREAAERSRRAETAAKNQIRIHEALLSEIGRIIQQNALWIAAIGEFQEEISQKLEQGDYRQSLILEALRFRLEGARADKERLAGLIEEIKQSELDLIETEEVGLRRRLRLHHKNLSSLEIQKAAFGSASVPLYILNQIADEEDQIRELQARLDELIKSRSDNDLS